MQALLAGAVLQPVSFGGPVITQAVFISHPLYDVTRLSFECERSDPANAKVNAEAVMKTFDVIILVLCFSEKQRKFRFALYSRLADSGNIVWSRFDFRGDS